MSTIFNISTLNFYFSVDSDIDRDIYVYCGTPSGTIIKWMESLDGFDAKYREVPKHVSIRTELVNEHDADDFVDVEEIHLMY